MVNFDEFLKTLTLRSNSVARQVTFDMTKIDVKCQNSKIQMRHFEGFLNTVQWLKITIQKSKVYSHCDKSQFFVHLYIFIDETIKRLFDTLCESTLIFFVLHVRNNL